MTRHATLLALITLAAASSLDAAPLPSAAPASLGCPGDFDGNGRVDTGDLLLLLSQWGRGSGTSDFWGPDQGPDGMVNIYDLLALLQRWGPC